jgi:hypothetical protein
MATHYLLRIGNGLHFNSSSIRRIWGVNSTYPFTKKFLLTVKEGDILWFVKGGSQGQIVAVATFKEFKSRILGPLIPLTFTDEELE